LIPPLLQPALAPPVWGGGGGWGVWLGGTLLLLVPDVPV
jgi:hypothetical protein